MEKQQLISLIQRQIEEGTITKDEISQLIGGTQISQVSQTQVIEKKEDHTKNLINIFYGIGAIIVLIGVIVLIAQNWTEIGFIGRIGVTLGISFVAYVLGFVLVNHEQKILSPLAFVISAALAPLGSYVWCDELNIRFDITTQIIVSTLITVLFANALLITKKNILILVTIGYSTWLYFAIFAQLLDSGYVENELIKWAVMFLGIAYLLISYGLVDHDTSGEHLKEKKSIQRVLYAFGTLGVLGAGIAVGGFFDVLFIAVLFGMFYLSIYVKSSEMLTFSALFLMAHIIKLTAEYFTDTLGWPIALIGIGLMIISVGYATFYINKNYISTKA
jgi:hypothetical protein